MNCRRKASQGKKWISSFLVMCMLISSFAFAPTAVYAAESVCGHTDADLASANEEAFTTGNGSTVPYIITSAKQLNHLRQHMTEKAVLGADIDLASFQTGAGWVPIGDTSGIMFTGELDGAGHIIKNLRINETTGVYQEKGVGLFGGVTDSGVVKNLVLSDFSVATANGTGYWLGTGGLIGVLRAGTVENIAIVNGTVSETGVTKGTHFVGGLIGHIGEAKTNKTQRIQNIFSNSVTATLLGDGIEMCIGGVIGSYSESNSGSKYSIGNIVTKDTQTKREGSGSLSDASDNISVLVPAGSNGRYDITANEAHAETLAVGLGELDLAAWSKAAGYYPILKAFNGNDAALALLRNNAKIEGGTTPPAGKNTVTEINESIFNGLMSVTTGYGTTNTLLKSERDKLADGKKLVYVVDNGTGYDLYYSTLLGAYIGYVPFVATKGTLEAHLQEKAGTAEIKYGIIGTGWDSGSRSTVEFADLYYFDKVALYDATLPNGQFQRLLAMDVDANFSLDIADLYSLIYNYVLGTPFSKASN